MSRATGRPGFERSSPAFTLCASLAHDLGVSGASISVVSPRGGQSTICSSDATAAKLETLQFELGEGPHWDALAQRTSSLCDNLFADSEARWPLLAAGAVNLGVVAIFAFPMMMGAALVGVVDLYCTTAHNADRDFVVRATLAAGRAAMPSAQRALRLAADHASEETLMAPALRREVHQATGMIIAQLAIDATEAFARLQAHAFATARPIDDVAHDVVHGRIHFDRLPD